MNIDEFLDTVAAQNVSKIPIQSTSMGVNSVPSDAFVRSIMNAKFTEPPKPDESTQSTSVKDSQKSPSSSTTPATNSQPVTGAIEQFESLCVALETSLATADYQHAFDTYIALQAALAHLHEQQKRQQRQFQGRLNEFKTRLFAAVQLSTAQFQSVMQELTLQIGQIKQLVDSNQIEAATNQYTSVKHTIEQLPNNFSDKKEKLQDELLKVYLYLKSRSETHVASSFADISTDMKRLYVSAVAAIKTGNLTQAQQFYEQLAARYAQLPDGFTEQKVQLFDYVTFLHSQLNLDVTNTPRASVTASTSASIASTASTNSDSQSSVPFMPASFSKSNSLSTAPTRIASTVMPAQVNQVMTSTSSSNKSLSPEKPVINVKKNTVQPEKDVEVLKKEGEVVADKNSQDKNSSAINISGKEQEMITRLLQNVPKPEFADSQSVSKKQAEPERASPNFRVQISPTVIGNLEPSLLQKHMHSAPAQKVKSQARVVPSQVLATQLPENPNLQSAQQLQERAKKLAARLIELKQSLEQ